MLLNYLLQNQDWWFVPLILQGVTYFLLFGKMDIPQLLAFIPGVADWRLTKELFPRTRSFWRPFFTTTLLVLCAAYLDPFNGTGRVTARIFLWIAIFVYETFLFRLYMRLGRSFGKGRGILFGIAATLLPPLFISLLALNKNAQYTPPEFKPQKQYGPFLTFLGRFVQFVFSTAEALVLIAVVGFFTVRAYPPRILADTLTSDILRKTSDITGGDRVVTREESMGDAAANLVSMPTSRDKFFPDHSQDKSVVVIEYIIGSDLEDRAGLASANIKQMIDATKKGSALTFVLQTGGSQRWFVDGIKDGTYARYIVHDGKLEKVQDLSGDTCMSEPETLEDFLIWAKETYPADRYMLAFWDHGGGLSTGYGYDALNKRDSDIPILGVNEIVGAVDKCGIKFDIIGFDACLMQDIEVATAFEPYADYYLASEETEGGFGWFYTSAFGMLAQNPGMSSEDFGREMVACYDPYNTIIKGEGDEPDTLMTLSFVDLPLAKAAYQQMEGFFVDARDAIRQGSTSYADLSLAGTNAYTFANNEQVDLIDFLNIVNKLDYEDIICTDEEGEALINSVKACVLYRNKDSADGINGMALSFPVKSISSYTDDYKQLNHFSYVPQRDFCNDFFSIMSAQTKKSLESYDSERASVTDFIAYLNNSLTDMSDQEWYVEGFEDYEDTPAFLNIPLIELENSYKIDLPQDAWDIIADEQLVVYQKRADGLMRYLGSDTTVGPADENGHPTLAMDGTWIHVGGNLCAYTPGEVRTTEQGYVFTGTTLARLNGTSTVKLYIEWDPLGEGESVTSAGRIVGYDDADVTSAFGFFSGLIEDNETVQELFVESFMSKGKNQLQPGDVLEFLFDLYDDQGEPAGSETLGNLIVTSQDRIVVSDQRLAPCDVVFGGVLTDVYQRTMTTELIEASVE